VQRTLLCDFGVAYLPRQTEYVLTRIARKPALATQFDFFKHKFAFFGSEARSREWIAELWS